MIYLMMKRIRPFEVLLRDTPNEGGNGGTGTEGENQNPGEGGSNSNTSDDDAAKAAKADSDAQKLVDEAKAAADEAAEKAKNSGDDGDKAAAQEKADLLKEVMDKKAKLAEARKEAEETGARLAEYEGIDPKRAKELLKKEEEAEKKRLEAQGEFDRVKKMMNEEREREREESQKVIDELKAQRAKDQERIDDLTIGVNFSSSKFVSNDLVISPAKARQLYGSHFEMKDGEMVAYDKPAGKSDRTMLVNATGDPLPFDDAMKKIIEADPDKDTLIKSKTRPGSRSSSNNNGEKSAPKTDNLFGVSRIAATIGNIDKD